MAKTRIGSPTSDHARVRMRGRDVVNDLMGQHRFSEVFYLIVTGSLPSPAQGVVLDACLIALMDHGLTPHALVSRLTNHALPEDLQVSVAAGLLLVGDKYAGAMAELGAILEQGVAFSGDPTVWARDVLRAYRETKRRVPGFGHSYYSDRDPRADRILRICQDRACAGNWIQALSVLGAALDLDTGKHIPLNVTGAIAAALGEIGFPVTVMRGVAVLARAAGLVGHLHEERTTPLAPDIVGYGNTVEYVE